jgi:hypothetical protein
MKLEGIFSAVFIKKKEPGVFFPRLNSNTICVSLDLTVLVCRGQIISEHERVYQVFARSFEVF